MAPDLILLLQKMDSAILYDKDNDQLQINKKLNFFMGIDAP